MYVHLTYLQLGNDTYIYCYGSAVGNAVPGEEEVRLSFERDSRSQSRSLPTVFESRGPWPWLTSAGDSDFCLGSLEALLVMDSECSLVLKRTDVGRETGSLS